MEKIHRNFLPFRGKLPSNFQRHEWVSPASLPIAPPLGTQYALFYIRPKNEQRKVVRRSMYESNLIEFIHLEFFLQPWDKSQQNKKFIFQMQISSYWHDIKRFSLLEWISRLRKMSTVCESSFTHSQHPVSTMYCCFVFKLCCRVSLVISFI
jgi:hypothetical protein